MKLVKVEGYIGSINPCPFLLCHGLKSQYQKEKKKSHIIISELIMSLGYSYIVLIPRVVCCFLFPTDDMIVILVLDNALWRFRVHLG